MSTAVKPMSAAARRKARRVGSVNSSQVPLTWHDLAREVTSWKVMMLPVWGNSLYNAWSYWQDLNKSPFYDAGVEYIMQALKYVGVNAIVAQSGVEWAFGCALTTFFGAMLFAEMVK